MSERIHNSTFPQNLEIYIYFFEILYVFTNKNIFGEIVSKKMVHMFDIQFDSVMELHLPKQKLSNCCIGNWTTINIPVDLIQSLILKYCES